MDPFRTSDADIPKNVPVSTFKFLLPTCEYSFKNSIKFDKKILKRGGSKGDANRTSSMDYLFENSRWDTYGTLDEYKIYSASIVGPLQVPCPGITIFHSSVTY